MKTIRMLFFVIAGLCLMAACEKEEDNNNPATTVTDGNGNVYLTVTIGDQVWMAENLKTTKYIDGRDIPLVTDNNKWKALTTPVYCWYNNDEATYGNTYGALYNWHTINNYSLCPTGWHIPDFYEWYELMDSLGG